DHTTVGERWASALFDAHSGPWGAVGGPVEQGASNWINDAIFLCEYARYMMPLGSGDHLDLPGNNVSYKRDDLLRHVHLLQEGHWESWIHDALRAEGVPLCALNEAAVQHIKSSSFRDFLVQRFHFARSYAGMRRSGQASLLRLAYGLGAVLLPPIL